MEVKNHELVFLNYDPHSPYQWGHHIEDLKRAIAETERILVRVAQRRTLITYSDLCEQIKSARFTPDDHAFHAVLGEVSVRGDKSGKGLLSVLVVYKDKNKQRPGPGFFNMGRWLGHELPDSEAEDRFWGEQAKRVYEANRRFGRVR